MFSGFIAVGSPYLVADVLATNLSVSDISHTEVSVNRIWQILSL
jgi:hypothetical protein